MACFWLCRNCAGDFSLRDAVGFVDMALFMRPRLGHNPVGLMSILRGEIPMSL
jgi:hypothetical protein